MVKMSDHKCLISCLRKLEPTGYNGFEGLILKLMEKFTGERFYLARSGSQFGKDFSNADWLAVECKRYAERTPLHERELLGEVDQAYRANPNLDLWVLVTSIPVDNQLAEALIYNGREKGVEILFIESKEDGSGNLQLLCADGDHIFIQFLENNLKTNVDTDGIKKYLKTIKVKSDYQNKIEILKNDFLKRNLGYDHFRVWQNNWLLERFESPEKSRYDFNQSIAICDQESAFIKRTKALEKFDCWFTQWRNGERKMFILSGEEGDGKTWAVASWIAENIKKDDNTIPFVFLPARFVSSADIIPMLAHVVSKWYEGLSDEYWEKRFKNWLTRPPSTDPLLVLVIDGLNEYFDFDWVTLLDKLNNTAGRFYNRIAVVVVVRTIYWQEKQNLLSDIKKEEWTLPSFDDDEFTEALKKYNLTIADFSSDIQPLIRKPRYFDLAVRYRKEMAESGDMTLPRLIYEDFKDRCKRMHGHPLDDKEFERLIMNLAEKSVKSYNSRNLFDEADMVPQNKEKKELIFQELITGGIFIRDDNQKHKVKLDPNRLACGLGVLLASELNNLSSKDPKVIEDAIHKFLEPQPEIDFKTDIAAFAVYQEMTSKNHAEEICYELLKYWCYSLNRKWNVSDDFFSYFQRNPSLYLKLAEDSTGFNSLDFQVNKSLRYLFVYWVKKCPDLFKAKFEEWVGYVDIYGFFRRNSDDEKTLHKKMMGVADRMGLPSITTGSINFLGFSFILTDDDEKSRLATLALSVISKAERRLFLNAIIKRVVAESIMGYCNDREIVEWLLRTNKKSLWGDLEIEVQKLIGTNQVVAQKAAFRLLDCEGSPQAIELRNSLPPDLFGQNNYPQEYEKDPCSSSYELKKEHYFDCLKRQDVQLTHLNWRIKQYALEPDLPVPDCYIQRLIECGKTINPVLLWSGHMRTESDHFFKQNEINFYAFCPEIIAELINTVIRERNRNIKYTNLVFQLTKNYLIFGKPEMDAIKETWGNHSYLKSDDQYDWKEEFLFLLILIESSPIEQLRLLINWQGHIRLEFGNYLKKLHEPCWNEVAALMEETDENSLWKLLFCISNYPMDIPKSLLREIGKYFNHPNKLVRDYALKIAYHSKDPELIEIFLQSQWKYQPGKKYSSNLENYYGCCFIAHFALHLTYEEIRERVSPDWISYAIYSRGMKQDEVGKFTRDFVFWGEDVGQLTDRVPSVNTDFCGFYCDKHVVREIVRSNPSLIQHWLKPISPFSPKADETLYYHHEFYESLFQILLETDQEAGVQLFRRLREINPQTRYVNNITRISILMYDVFAPNRMGEELGELWDEIMQGCLTDKDVLEISIVCHVKLNTAWYLAKAEDYISSDILIDKATGINMLGFSCENTAINRLNALKEEIPDCWLKPVIETAVKRWNLNHWARIWYLRFLEYPNDISAWAAFNLFLKCADRRFWAWKKQLDDHLEEKDFSKKRDVFYQLNEDRVKESIKKNEEDFEKEFLGEKIDKSIHPWLL